MRFLYTEQVDATVAAAATATAATAGTAVDDDDGSVAADGWWLGCLGNAV